MAVQDQWAQYLEQGYIPLGNTTQRGGTGSVRDVQRIGSRDDLYNWILSQAQGGPGSREGYGRGGAYTQQDIYDFFIRPEEERRFQEATERYRTLYGQTQQIGGPAGQIGARLGLGGTGLGARMGRAIGRERGGLAASRGLAEAQKTAVEEINRPGRLRRIDDLVSAKGGRTERRADTTQHILGGTGAAVATGLGITAAGLAATGIGAPFAAIPLGILAGIAGAAGTVGGVLGAKDVRERGEQGMTQFYGPKHTLDKASFDIAQVPMQAVGPGSSQYALSNAYRSPEEEKGAFQYGA